MEVIDISNDTFDDSLSSNGDSDANSCIGIKIEKQLNYSELHQCNYVQYILERFGMMDCKPVKTPTEVNLKLTTENHNC